MNKSNNPFDAQYEKSNHNAYERGFAQAVVMQTDRLRTVEQKYKSDAAEGFIEALYLLAQEYGGERFVYTDNTQTKLEKLTKEMTDILSRVRTLR